MDARNEAQGAACSQGLDTCRISVCKFVPPAGFSRPSRLIKLRRRDRLAINGDNCDRLWVIVSGVAVTCSWLHDGRRQLLDLELPGDVICGFSSISGSDYGLKALSDCIVCELDLDGIRGPLREHPDFIEKLYTSMHKRLERGMTQLVSVGQLSSTEKVCQFLFDMSERIGLDHGGHTIVDLPMTRDDIADYLGLNTETVSRIFSKLKKSGLIEFEGRTNFCVPDIDALRNKALLSPAYGHGTDHTSPHLATL